MKRTIKYPGGFAVDFLKWYATSGKEPLTADQRRLVWLLERARCNRQPRIMVHDPDGRFRQVIIDYLHWFSTRIMHGADIGILYPSGYWRKNMPYRWAYRLMHRYPQFHVVGSRSSRRFRLMTVWGAAILDCDRFTRFSYINGTSRAADYYQDFVTSLADSLPLIIHGNLHPAHRRKIPGIFSYLLSAQSRFIELRPTDATVMKVTLGSDRNLSVPILLTDSSIVDSDSPIYLRAIFPPANLSSPPPRAIPARAAVAGRA